MNTNKAAYWIALGVLALGLNSEYQQGRFEALHRIAGRADSALCQISMRAKDTLALARILRGREDLPADNLLASADQAEMARDQAEMLSEQAQDQAEILSDTVGERVRERVRERVQEKVREGIRERVLDQVNAQIHAQADLIRAQAEIQRAEIEIRRRADSQVRFALTADRHVRAVCPTTRSRIVVNTMPESGEAAFDLPDTD